MREEQNFKLQGKILSLQNQLELTQNDNVDRMENLHAEWENKHEGMIEEYENRLELAQKEKVFLKGRI